MFSNRACQQWNDLEGEVAGAGSVNGSKRGVGKILRGKFLGGNFFNFRHLGMLDHATQIPNHMHKISKHQFIKNKSSTK